MIRIIVGRVLGQTSCWIDVTDEPAARGHSDLATTWTNLAYRQGEDLAHDETGMLLQLVGDTIRAAEQRSAEHGGWGILSL